MRMPTAYETYLRCMSDYYRIKKVDRPEWIEKAKSYYGRLYHAARSFAAMCHNTAIPKATMNYLADLDRGVLEDLPKELIEGSEDIHAVFKAMYRELVSGKEAYFINEWTLSKAGRRKMREYIKEIPSAAGIMPPKCEFTNVPEKISFSNRIRGYEAEYKLCVYLGSSRIYLENGDCKNTVRVDFTEHFLDEVIPLMQWENFEHLLHRPDRSEARDESVYQDFRTVLVEVDRYEFDLVLSTDNADHVFIKLLMLVWEEYGELLSEKDFILPWFYTMGCVRERGKQLPIPDTLSIKMNGSTTSGRE